MQKKLLITCGCSLQPNFFNIAVNDLDAKKSACCSWVLVVTELIVSSTQWTFVYYLIPSHSLAAIAEMLLLLKKEAVMVISSSKTTFFYE